MEECRMEKKIKKGSEKEGENELQKGNVVYRKEDKRGWQEDRI